MVEKKEKPYNRIVLIGNGFDKALGLNTSYCDFILDFLVKNLTEAFEIGNNKNTNLVSFMLKSGYEPTVSDPKFLNELRNFKTVKDLLEAVSKYVTIAYKYTFFKDIITKFEDVNWVDIEQYYYEQLKDIEFNIQNSKPMYRKGKIANKLKEIIEINNCMDFLTVALNDFIKDQQNKTSISNTFFNSHLKSLSDYIFNPLKWNEVLQRYSHLPPEKVIFLNFNYTNTVLKILKLAGKESNSKHIYIHGKVDDSNNPIIFGYGDDTGDVYKQLELYGNNEWLRKIKSFQYPRTNNYHRLLYYLGEIEFDVFVIGHSCGITDKTLLKTIFEHKNCLAIKNFHYKGEVEDFDKRINISRHFEDKVLMRERLLPFDEHATIPQL